MSGLLQWIQGMGQPTGAPPGATPPPALSSGGIAPQFQDALKNVWQKYTSGGAPPPMLASMPKPAQPAPGMPGQMGGLKPPYAPPPGASQNMNPSSIRVDFHRPESEGAQ